MKNSRLGNLAFDQVRDISRKLSFVAPAANKARPRLLAPMNERYLNTSFIIVNLTHTYNEHSRLVWRTRRSDCSESTDTRASTSSALFRTSIYITNSVNQSSQQH
jgi:hypothetical protein